MAPADIFTESAETIYSKIKVHWYVSVFLSAQSLCKGQNMNEILFFIWIQMKLCSIVQKWPTQTFSNNRHNIFSFPRLSVRGGSLPARGWTGAAGGVGGKQTGADLPGWWKLASAVPLDSQQQQHRRLDTTVQVSYHDWLVMCLTFCRGSLCCLHFKCLSDFYPNFHPSFW